jgi:hypothetical protein
MSRTNKQCQSDREALAMDQESMDSGRTEDIAICECDCRKGQCTHQRRLSDAAGELKPPVAVNRVAGDPVPRSARRRWRWPYFRLLP